MAANFNLTQGEILQIGVGGAGTDNAIGGGGSFIVGPNNAYLIIAGGGVGGGVGFSALAASTVAAVAPGRILPVASSVAAGALRSLATPAAVAATAATPAMPVATQAMAAVEAVAPSTPAPTRSCSDLQTGNGELVISDLVSEPAARRGPRRSHRGLVAPPLGGLIDVRDLFAQRGEDGGAQRQCRRR